MPRRRIDLRGGLVFHIWNRAVRRATLFYGPADYQAVLNLIAEAQRKCPTIRLLAYCIMPNHWHLVLWPAEDGAVTAFLACFTQKHAVRWERVHGTRGTGPVYQGRFKARLVTTPASLYAVCAYVECNPYVARLVARAGQWPWSSASQLPPPGERPRLDTWPIARPPSQSWSDLLAVRDGRTRRAHCADVVARYVQTAPDCFPAI